MKDLTLDNGVSFLALNEDGTMSIEISGDIPYRIINAEEAAAIVNHICVAFGLFEA